MYDDWGTPISIEKKRTFKIYIPREAKETEK
jgi:hypothetical protein